MDAEVLTEKGIDAEAEDCARAKLTGLCGDYELIVLGCQTYGEDEIEIQENFAPLLDDIEDAGIEGKKVAIFGCGFSHSSSIFPGRQPIFSPPLVGSRGNCNDGRR